MSIPKFKNEPLIDFSKSNNRKAQEAAIKKVRAEFGKEYPIVIGGEKWAEPVLAQLDALLSACASFQSESPAPTWPGKLVWPIIVPHAMGRVKTSFEPSSSGTRFLLPQNVVS